MKTKRYTWKQFDSDVIRLIRIIKTSGHQPRSILTVSRGGLPLGAALSNRLNLPLSIISARSYYGDKDFAAKTSPMITGVIVDKIQSPILLVDDTSDSGETMKLISNMYKAYGVVLTATLFYKEKSKFKPDWFLRKTNLWIRFPWEG